MTAVCSLTNKNAAFQIWTNQVAVFYITRLVNYAFVF